MSVLVILGSTETARGGQDAANPSVELPPELARVLTDYETAYRIGGEELALLFAENGFVLAGGRPPVRGRSAISAYYGGARGPLSLRAIAYDVGESIGYIIGGYTSERGAPDAGKFTLTLIKDANGRWLIFRTWTTPTSEAGSVVAVDHPLAADPEQQEQKSVPVRCRA